MIDTLTCFGFLFSIFFPLTDAIPAKRALASGSLQTRAKQLLRVICADLTFEVLERLALPRITQFRPREDGGVRRHCRGIYFSENSVLAATASFI